MAPGLIVRSPETFIVLLFMVKVPPVITTFVGASVLPVLLVQTPPVAICISPPMVVLVPFTFTAAEGDTLLPTPPAPPLRGSPLHGDPRFRPPQRQPQPRHKNSAAAVTRRVARETCRRHR